MGFNFRKSIKVGKNIRINLSKSGIGISGGVKGARVSVNQKGTRTTLSVPGTGISHTSYKPHGKSNKNTTGGRENGFESTQYLGNTIIFNKGKYYSKPLIAFSIFAALFLLAVTLLINKGVLMAMAYLVYNIFLFKRYKTDSNQAYKFYNQALKTKDCIRKLELLETAKELDNNNTLVNYYLAHISFESGNHKKVLEYIDGIKDYKGIDQQELTRIYIMSLFETENYQKVIDILEGGIDTDLSGKLLVALSYKGLGQVKKASEILATGPVNKRIYDNTVLIFKYELGLCYLELGDKSKAKRQLGKVYEVNSSYKDIVKYAQELGFSVGEHLQ